VKESPAIETGELKSLVFLLVIASLTSAPAFFAGVCL
jgi:hypothetical protein